MKVHMKPDHHTKLIKKFPRKCAVQTSSKLPWKLPMEFCIELTDEISWENYTFTHL